MEGYCLWLLYTNMQEFVISKDSYYSLRAQDRVSALVYHDYICTSIVSTLLCFRTRLDRKESCLRPLFCIVHFTIARAYHA